MEHPHSKPVEDIAQALDTPIGQGLSAEEAERRLNQYGPNQLDKQQQKSLFLLFIEQFNTPVAYLLFAAAG